MEVSRVRRPVWTIVLSSLCAGLAILSLCLYQFIQTTESRRWAELKSQLDSLVQEIRSRDPNRPVLRGPPQPGNCWEDYGPAIASIPAADTLDTAWQFLCNSPKANRGKVQALVDLHAQALQSLRRGVCRSAGTRQIEGDPSSHSGRQVTLGYLATCHARFLFEDARPREAAERLLDLVQFGSDIARSGCFGDASHAVSVWSVSLEELRSIVNSGRLPKDDLLEVARELEILDQGFPRLGDSLVNDAFETGIQLLQHGNVEAFLKPYLLNDQKISPWRFGFSERIMMADAFQVKLVSMRRLREGDEMPWAVAKTIQPIVFEELATSSNPLIRVLYSAPGRKPGNKAGLITPFDLFRETRAQLRILRTAAMYLSNGEILGLDDPFGGKLLISMGESRLKIWSVGANGVDDGGTGGWSPKSSPDIVLEVKR